MANENMIQTHLDNFLAKIAGETPIDENPRNSTEFWLDKIAEWTGGKSTDDASTKKLYYHPIALVQTTGDISYHIGGVIIDNNPTAYNKDTFVAKVKTFSRLIPFNGYFNDGTDGYIVCYAFTSGTTVNLVLRKISDGSFNVSTNLAVILATGEFYDGVNALN